MRKLIHSNFELDLSNLKLSDTEENNWFSDSFFSKYSFPFVIDLDANLDSTLGFISQYNADNVETYFNLKYIHGDIIEDAVLEIESHQDKLSLVLYFGFEQLPTFEKKLSDLPLDKYKLAANENIYDYANTIIAKTWPDVNYNFPQVHIDKIDTTDEIWTAFEGIINNRKNGAFLRNTVDTAADINYNKNIMQPMSYFIYLLDQIAKDAGYTLAGDVLMDSRLQKACLYGDVDYYTQMTLQAPVSIAQTSADQNHYDAATNKNIYYSNTPITTPGKYTITGNIKTQNRSNCGAYFVIKFRGSVIWSNYSKSVNFWKGSTFDSHDIDLSIITVQDLKPNDITIESYQAITKDETIIDLTISCVYINNATGAAVASISNDNKIDLTKAVPDITVIDFIKTIKNWFNYDLTIVGKLIVMNKIENAMNYDNAISLENKEVKRPLRTFASGNSFLLKFQDIDNKDYSFLPVFHSKDSIVNSKYIIDGKTIPIEVNALPLPLITRNSIQTAYALESNNAKVYLVKYDGLYNGNNFAQSNSDYLMPEIHANYWAKYFQFRIDSHSYRWNYLAWNEELANLKANTKIFAYNKYHFIKTINKTEQKTDLFSIEIETYSLE